MNTRETIGAAIILILSLVLIFSFISNGNKSNKIENLEKEVIVKNDLLMKFENKLNDEKNRNIKLSRNLTLTSAEAESLKFDIDELKKNYKFSVSKYTSIQEAFDIYVEKMTTIDNSALNKKFIQAMNHLGAGLILTYCDGYVHFDDHSKQLIIDADNELICLRQGLKYEKR